MICRIEGVLESIDNDRAHVAVDGGLVYELLLPGFVAARLGGQIGSAVTLHTVHFLEGTSQGANMIPRLAGFSSAQAKAFYELFTTVKGIGPRKALRAMSMDHRQIATAIAERDVKMLQTLPEIGKRMAETIVATLHGRVDAFVTTAPGGAETAAQPSGPPMRHAAREALEVLVQLGESRPAAARWIDDVLRRQPDLDDAQQIITHALTAKAGG
jgi:Holliday junction DNA helicase RuvA